MRKDENSGEGHELGRMAPNMGAGGSYPQAISDPEKKEDRRETRGMRWADCEDDEGKEEEERKQEEERRAQEAREEEMRAQEAREKEVSAQGERESHMREGPKRARWRKKEMTTQEKCVEIKKEAKFNARKNDVSNRHMSWWKNARWIRVDSGPHMRTARGPPMNLASSQKGSRTGLRR